jgi:hypothetical protein
VSDDDFTDAWTPEMWRKALRAAEDALATQNASVLKFTHEADRIIDELWLLARSGRGVTASNRARKEVADARHAEWQRLRDQGLSAATVAMREGVKPETVYRKTKKRKP